MGIIKENGTDESDADQRSWSPPSGTVVDNGIIEARNWDFHLQAHAAEQGTAKPAYYYVLYDEIIRKQQIQSPLENHADLLQDLMHNMCYLFGRATKAVSVCPPACYASLLCAMVKCYLKSYHEQEMVSSAGGSIAGDGGARLPDLRLHENVCDRMPYI